MIILFGLLGPLTVPFYTEAGSPGLFIYSFCKLFRIAIFLASGEYFPF